jgi:16S rRNA (guanine527-N7)-methyltransferase
VSPRATRQLDASTQIELGLLAARYNLAPAAQAKLGLLLEHLESEPHAPTTVRRAVEAVNVHIADSLVASDLEPVRAARSIADLGAGAGFPGLVLAAVLPGARVHLVESVGRKCAHIAAAIRHAGLENAEAVNARAEDWPDGLGANDLVTVRAVAALPVLAEYAAPLLVEGGRLLAWKGAPAPAEIDAGRRAGELLGLELEDVLEVDPFEQADHRSLVVMRKVSPTPPRYPRRLGVAQKRPLA